MVRAQSEYDALVSSTHLVGIDSTLSGQSGVDVFRNARNHPSAVASILLQAAHRSGFRPRQKGVITKSHIFGDFIHESTRFPAVKPQIEYDSELELSGDRHQLKEVIEGAYHPKVNQPKAVASALEGLIPTRLLPGHSRQVWVLSHITLQSESHRDIAFELAYIELTLTRDHKTGAVKIEPQRAHFSANAYRIDSDMLIQNADRFAQQIPTVTVSRFLKELSTTGEADHDNDEPLDGCLDEENKDMVHGRSGHLENPHRTRVSPFSHLRIQH